MAKDKELQETDLQRLEGKIDDLIAAIEEQTESLKIFKLNFQQSMLIRR